MPRPIFQNLSCECICQIDWPPNVLLRYDNSEWYESYHLKMLQQYWLHSNFCLVSLLSKHSLLTCIRYYACKLKFSKGKFCTVKFHCLLAKAVADKLYSFQACLKRLCIICHERHLLIAFLAVLV